MGQQYHAHGTCTSINCFRTGVLASLAAVAHPAAEGNCPLLCCLAYICWPSACKQHVPIRTCPTLLITTSPNAHLPASMQGFAYVEFLEVDAVSNAVLLDNTELRGRQIKVRGWARLARHAQMIAAARAVDDRPSIMAGSLAEPCGLTARPMRTVLAFLATAQLLHSSVRRLLLRLARLLNGLECSSRVPPSPPTCDQRGW